MSPELVGSRLPPAVEHRIRSMGAVFDPEVAAATRQLLEPAGATAAAGRHREVSYGDHPRQTADLYLPVQAGAHIIVFVPGGGFVGGDKSRYATFGSSFARAGYLVVIANYRLAPEAPYPQGSDDVVALLTWCRRHLTASDGTAPNLHLMGHSAGATHCALAMFDQRYEAAIPGAVSSLTLLSGLYRLVGRSLGEGPLQYFGADIACHERRQPLSQVRRMNVPVVIGRAELDPADLYEDSGLLAEALVGAGSTVRFLEFAGHNHISTVTGLALPGHGVADALARATAETGTSGAVHGQS